MMRGYDDEGLESLRRHYEDDPLVGVLLDEIERLRGLTRWGDKVFDWTSYVTGSGSTYLTTLAPTWKISTSTVSVPPTVTSFTSGSTFSSTFSVDCDET